MIKRTSPIWYALFCAVMMTIDRVTKSLMLWHGEQEIQIFPFASLKLCFNRGISWGILHSQGMLKFVIVIVMTLLITCGLLWYAIRQWKTGRAVWWETLVISGAVSNLFDRFMHNGVVDFVACSYGRFVFPSFNFADACIVIGVIGMMLTSLTETASSRA